MDLTARTDQRALESSVPARGAETAAHGGTGRAAMDREADRTWPSLVLAVVAGSGAVAIGAAGLGMLTPPGTPDASWVPAARVAGTVAAVVGLVALYVQREGLLSSDARGTDPTIGGFLGAATIMGVLVILALLAPNVGRDAGGPDGSSGGSGAAVDPDATGAPPPPSSTAPVTEGVAFDRGEPEPQPSPSAEGPELQPSGGFDWGLLRELTGVLLPILVMAATVIVLLALLVRWRHRREGPSPEEEADAAADAGDLPAEHPGWADDPRGRVTAAYRRLLAALGEAGAGRRPQEAPHEHLDRTLALLGVRAGPMHRLAGLYVVAQFGGRPVTEAQGTAAVETLDLCLTDLDAVRGPGTAGADPPGEGVPV